MIFTVAIDGPAAAGKGTISRAVAKKFGFAHLDTGLLYRAVGVKGGDPVVAARSLCDEDLARPDLRTLAAGQAASRVAVLPEVRAALAVRAEVLQLILSEHPASCLVCDEREECRTFMGTIRKAGRRGRDAAHSASAIRPITAANDIWNPGLTISSGRTASIRSAAIATARMESAGRSAITPSSIAVSMRWDRTAGEPPPLIIR